MSDKTSEPQEWTRQDVDKMLDADGTSAVVLCHNAALAAVWKHSDTIAKLADDQAASFNATLAAERKRISGMEAAMESAAAAEKQLRKELAAAEGALHHMEACRALLKVPNDEVLYTAIEELQQQLEKLDELEAREFNAGGAEPQ